MKMNRIRRLLIMFFLLANYGCKKDDNPANSSTQETPTLIFPVNSSTNIVLKPALVWNKVENAASYNLQVSAQVNFSNIVQSYSNITDTSQTLTLLSPNTLYYWRLNISDGKNVSGWTKPFSFTTGKDSVVQINFNWISVEGSSFLMGSESGDPDEKPVHNISLNNFSISQYEVTYDQFDLFCDATGRMKPNDNGWGRGNKPVTNVSWNDAADFCKWVTSQTGKTIRLPTEAEWEFAAKGGILSNGFLYSGGDSLNEIAWNFTNAIGSTHDVGTKKGNELGIFDMSGNVWEWCGDWFDETYYSYSPSVNPKGPLNGTQKVIRGGSWASFTVPGGEGEIVVNGCRVTDRSNSDPSVKSADFGFRCVIEE